MLNTSVNILFIRDKKLFRRGIIYAIQESGLALGVTGLLRHVIAYLRGKLRGLRTVIFFVNRREIVKLTTRYSQMRTIRPELWHTGRYPFLHSSQPVCLCPASWSLRRYYRQTRISMVSTGTESAQNRINCYSGWDHERLVARISELEKELEMRNGQAPVKGNDVALTRPVGRTKKKPRKIDPSKYSMRFIALKFAYLGQNYNGYEHANGNATPLPTIEEELWKALCQCRLIFPPDAIGVDSFSENQNRSKPFVLDWEGHQYSKCGRTDRGVSAFGQVIGLRVRSARPKSASPSCYSILETSEGEKRQVDHATANTEGLDGGEKWDDIADELPYLQILNNVLPGDIRILAWCPHPPLGFDARFSCRERRYKYFFTQPAFSPTPGPMGFLSNGSDVSKKREGWLDIEAMRQGAKQLVGEHDFRNFCKIDPSKQITNYVRKIYRADIELLDPQANPLSYLKEPSFRPSDDDKVEQTASISPAMNVYSFTVHGSAFLWHQVRHMVSLLFLIGQGLESPNIVSELLDVQKNIRRPAYDLASDAPLVLWDTVFPEEGKGSHEDALDWVYAGDPRALGSRTGQGDGKFGMNSTVDKLWSVWRRCKIDEILAGSLLDLAVKQGDPSSIERGGFRSLSPQGQQRNPKVFIGAHDTKAVGKYIPVMKRQKTDTVDELNARYRAKKEKKYHKDVSQSKDGSL